MAKFDSSTQELIINGTNMSAHTDAISPMPSKALIPLDTTVFADGGETFINGIHASKEVTVSGPYDNTATTGPDAVYASLVATGTVFTWTLFPASTAAGSRRYSGTGLPIDYEPGGGIKERVSYSFVFKVSGTYAVGTV